MHERSPESKKVGQAWIRLTLGAVQMAGAAAALFLLVQTGVNRFSVGAVALTGGITALSWVLFRMHPDH
ncbi:MAG: hypothetical protein Q7S40_15375 [Opitutaceae bacterium]|nr:hypothetical protein [Opitutaceae bacterium]